MKNTKNGSSDCRVRNVEREESLVTDCRHQTVSAAQAREMAGLRGGDLSQTTVSALERSPSPHAPHVEFSDTMRECSNIVLACRM